MATAMPMPPRVGLGWGAHCPVLDRLVPPLHLGPAGQEPLLVQAGRKEPVVSDLPILQNPTAGSPLTNGEDSQSVRPVDLRKPSGDRQKCSLP